jgi:G:T-mismatch repair DNA endonuclease (very short patch repair protein)
MKITRPQKRRNGPLDDYGQGDTASKKTQTHHKEVNHNPTLMLKRSNIYVSPYNDRRTNTNRTVRDNVNVSIPNQDNSHLNYHVFNNNDTDHNRHKNIGKRINKAPRRNKHVLHTKNKGVNKNLSQRINNQPQAHPYRGNVNRPSTSRDSNPTAAREDIPAQPPLEENQPVYSNKPYKVVVYRTRYIMKYDVEELIYQIKFAREWRHRTLGSLYSDFHDMFEDIIVKLKRKYDLDSKIRLFIQHPDFKYSAPVFIALRPLRDLSVETIMTTLESVINSNLDVSLTSEFRIDIGIIQPPNGNGVMKLTCGDLDNVMNERFYKRSMVVIPIIKGDHTCGARAVVVAVAQLRKDKAYVNLRNPKRATMQLKYAYKLLEDTNIPNDRALEVSQLSAFEIYYDVQIIVYQKPLKDGILYAGLCERDNKIFLYHNQGHFDVISNITGFLGKRNYCTKCLVPYASKAYHKCINYCATCESDNCDVFAEYIEGYLSCRTCKQTCRNITCFETHQQPNADGTMSLCATYRRCTKCRKRLSKKDVKEHICGTYKCTNCQKNNVYRNHKCFMRHTQPPNTSGKFLYYDFECTADDMYECSAGFKTASKDECKLCIDTGYICSRCNVCVNCCDSLCGKLMHKPCLVVAQTVCDTCKHNPFTADAKCKNCGSRCEICHVLNKGEKGSIPPPCSTCGDRQTIFSGKNAGENFSSWLFNRNHKNFTCLAHNSKSYDGVILLNHILSKTYLDVKCIYSGSKIISMTLPTFNIRCIDSMSFFPMALKLIPKIFGLACEKGDFPHLFNIRANQNYIGNFPDIKYYDIDSKSPKERNELIKWHASQKGKIFNFNQEIIKYCINDVKILREACTHFRDMVLHLTADSFELSKTGYEVPINAVDPFTSTTLSALCLSVFRSKYLPEKYTTSPLATDLNFNNADNSNENSLPAVNKSKQTPVVTGASRVIGNNIASSLRKKQNGKHNFQINKNKSFGKKKKIKKEGLSFESSPIGLIPQGGYGAHDTYSKKSILWLELIKKRKNIKILHALNGGEYHIPNTKYKADGYCKETNTIYSFHGCHWHGHPKCQRSKLNNQPDINTPASVLYAMTVARSRKLKDMGYRVIEMWECDFDKEMKQYLTGEEKIFLDTLDIQERLDARDALYGGRTETFRLYWVKIGDNYFSYYDVCSLYPFVNATMWYPILHPNIITTDFEEITEYFGVAKVKILPPRNLYIPVLPYRCNGKNTFPLCAKCAKTQQLTPCKCVDNDRAIIGTYITLELHKAVEMGYKVLKIYEVYHYDNKSDTLFADYIKKFIGLKTEASGFPDDVITEEQKLAYISEYERREGITLNKEKIAKNPGLRQIGKAFANNLWGRLSLRDNLKKTAYIRTPEEFNKLMTDPELQILDFKIINDDVLAIIYENKKQYIPLSLTTNSILSSFTTCYGRLVLYDALQKLRNRACYCDTDSVMFDSSITLLYEPTIPLGNYLGQFTDEIPAGKHVIEFCSTGPKSYSLLFNDNTQITKLRGFTLNHRNSVAINFDVMKKMVLNQDIQTTTEPLESFTYNPTKICRDKNRNIIYNRTEIKRFRAVFTKRVIMPDLTTVPYGYDWV